MNQKNLILIGGGGHCKSVIDVAESAGYNILGILDMPEEVGKSVLNYTVIGTDDDIPQYADKAEFITGQVIGVDGGMTVNFPDKLTSYILNRQ